MPDATTLRDEFCAEIERAFGHVQRGNGVTLHQAEVIDAYGSVEEQQNARKLDTEERWQDVPAADIARHACLTFLDAEGLLYYLPRVHDLELRNYDRDTSTWSIDHTIYTLSGSSAQSYAQYQFLFDEQQCAAIRHFLELMVLYAGEMVDDVEASKALPFWETYRVTPPHLRPRLISETVERLPDNQLLIKQVFVQPIEEESN